jgi:hypothetical protein
MSKKSRVFLTMLFVIGVCAIVLGVFIVRRPVPESVTTQDEQADEQEMPVSQTVVVEETSASVEEETSGTIEVVPETSPTQNTNPFEGTYTNPFE